LGFHFSVQKNENPNKAEIFMMVVFHIPVKVGHEGEKIQPNPMISSRRSKQPLFLLIAITCKISTPF
jgi:hypothetical protein